METHLLHRDGAWRAPWLPTWQPDGRPHPRKRPRSLCFDALLALMMLLMLACTAVEDPSARWQDSGMDPALEGEWRETKKNGEPGDRFSLAKHEGGWYAFAGNAKEPLAVRTFARGQRHFMLLVSTEAATDGFDKVAKDKRSGMVWFYQLDGKVLTLSLLDDKVLAEAIREGKIQGKGAEEGKADAAMVATLDDATCDALAELAKDPDAWEKVAEYRRTQDEPAPENRQ